MLIASHSGEGADEHFAGYAELRADSLLEPDYSWPPSFFPERAATSQSMAARQSGLSHFASGNDDTPESARRMLNFTKFPALVRSAAQLPFSPWVDHNMKTTPGEALAEHIYGRTQGAVTSKWHPLHTSLYTWIKTLFPSFLLRYVGDNIDAAHQIESRPAFLDHRLTEYANGLPPSLKMKYNPQAREFNEKYILREAVKPFVPEELYRRRKHPFLGPSRFQENGPLHQWVKALLTPENVDALGFLDWNQLSALLDKAFKERDPIALRPALLSAQFVVLSQRFHVPKAQPENVMDAGV